MRAGVRPLTLWLVGCAVLGALSLAPEAYAQRYAALVMDARSGKVLHARNADERLHPASLTKMMTLYIGFEAIERGEISADTLVRISKNAASEVPSKLGLRAGQKIKFKYLLRAAAVKSANDAATAIGEALSGSEAAFARRMTATAKAMGMQNTVFKNAHGLTARGHLSTARDMALLGRRLIYDHNDYYNMFGRISTRAGTKSVSNTNGRLLSSYLGADGIKTGYTRAAGYNLVASARRGNERIITSVFGGKSVGWRTAKVKELLDLGFRRAPTQSRVIMPHKIPYIGNAQIASLTQNPVKKLSTSVKQAYLPQFRPGGTGAADAVEVLVARAVMDEEIETAVATAVLSATRQSTPQPSMARPKARPVRRVEVASAIGAARTVQVAPKGVKSWAVNLGTHRSRQEAEQLLLVAALQEFTALDGAFRKIERVRENGRTAFSARFVGLSERDASRACARLLARQTNCTPVSPET